jgi:hypothetical protein
MWPRDAGPGPDREVTKNGHFVSGGDEHAEDNAQVEGNGGWWRKLMFWIDSRPVEGKERRELIKSEARKAKKAKRAKRVERRDLWR